METSAPTLLIIDDDESFLGSLQRALKRDFSIVTASNEARGQEAFAAGPDIVLLDIRLDESEDHNRAGVDLLKRFLESQIKIPIVMTSAYGDIEIAVECMRLGAADFIDKADLFRKSAGLKELRQRLNVALEHAKLTRKVEQLEERLERLEPAELIGQSPQLKHIKELIKVVGEEGYVTVLIRGQTGTGKELVARAIHRIGRRSKDPFVSVAIASLNTNLVESELFGHEAGAFTGAAKRRTGYIEEARGGCLFFDEIGDLPPDVQLKLLRFLEERKFSRVGSTQEINIDVQIICATNRNLEQAVAEGRIREDLYFRLKSLQIVLPPLCERLEDVPLLADHFLKLFRQQGRTRITDVSEDALAVLRKYTWPGNVRELKAVLERANIYANYHAHTRIEREDLPLELLEPRPSETGSRAKGDLRNGISLSLELAKAELSLIEQALSVTDERKTAAWKLLGLNDRFALRRRVKSLLGNHPELATTFPTVFKLYQGD